MIRLPANLLAVLALSVLLAACKSSTHVAPIDQLDQPPGIKLNYHTISRGDTLYSIAWRYGLDYRTLAAMNGIGPPYTIYAGRKLKVTEGGSGSESTSAYVGEGTQVVAIPETSSGVSEVGGGVTEVAAASEPAPAERTPEPSPAPALAPSPAGNWAWPARGRVLNRFVADDPLRKGIDIEGSLGEPVLAASSGSVVYAGSGLAGYGQLVIVKHNEQFLSAYGHNSKLLVKEGDAVKSGQKIAEIGSSGAERNQLHFEIRRAGRPVDPLEYLPRR